MTAAQMVEEAMDTGTIPTDAVVDAQTFLEFLAEWVEQGGAVAVVGDEL